jgi:hypothetical protein
VNRRSASHVGGSKYRYASEDQELRGRIIRLAYARPELRSQLLPLVLEGRPASGKQADLQLLAGRAWTQGQVYGPPYTDVKYRTKPPTNRGTKKCWYKLPEGERSERSRCYVKRNIPNSGNKTEYNRKWRQMNLERRKG